VRVAVLGLGSAGARHGRLLRELGHEPVGFDPAVEGGAPSLEQALDGADAAVVASPNRLHAEQALAAVQAGCAVLVEKPLAVDLADADRLVAAASRAGRPCGVAMNLRFHAGVLTLRRLLDEGALGRVLTAEVVFGYDLRRWRPDTDYRRSYSARRDLGGGILLDAIHELDYAGWLLGPAVDVDARCARLSDLAIDVEDTVLASVGLASGALLSVRLNFHEPAYRRGCHLVGTEATATWDWVAETVVVRRTEAPEETIDARCPVQETYRAELEDFVAAVVEGRAPRTSLAEGRDALALCDAIRRAAATGQRTRVSPAP
jgi:predicted dehydrogenase